MRGLTLGLLVLALPPLGVVVAGAYARADEPVPPQVALDLTARTARTAKGNASIGLSPDEMPSRADIALEPLVLDDGRSALHLRAPSTQRPGVAWEGIVLGDTFAYAGVTGYTRGEEGERTGEALQVARGSASGSGPPRARILLGSLREDLRLCGQQETLLAARVLDPASGTFRGASVQRVGEAQRAAAEKVAVRALPGSAGTNALPAAPLARLLEAAGASSAASEATSPRALVDGDPASAWVEGRPGAGRGEFVVLRAPAAVPLVRFTVTLAAAGGRAMPVTAPRVMYLVSDRKTFEITLPEGSSAARSFDLTLAEPVRTSCLALVLETADGEGARAANLAVGVAELTAYSAFDGPQATLAEVAAALRGGGARGESAAAVLERASAPGLAAVEAAFPALDDAGRALAIDVAASASACDESVPLLLAGSGSRGLEVARKARQKLERCGKSAVPKLTEALSSSDLGARGAAATFLADLAPVASLVPLARALSASEGDAGEASIARARVRAALGKAALRAEPESLSPLLSELAVPLEAGPPEVARVDRLRALAPALHAPNDAASAGILALLREGAPFRTRYLLAEPLAAIAETSAPVRARSLALLLHDDDPRVRAHLAEVLGRWPSTAPTEVAGALIEAARDAAPRVREAAAYALGRASSPEAQGAAAALLGQDPWTFVRIAAASSLGSASPSTVADAALDRALEDPSPRLREASASALGTRGASGAARHLQRHLEDDGEVPFVRAAAARALGALCARGATAALTTLAETLAEPRTETDFDVGLAAVESLGHLHPVDLDKRLSPLEVAGVRDEVRRAARLAKSASRTCPR